MNTNYNFIKYKLTLCCFLILFIPIGYSDNIKPTVCDDIYALCSSAPCQEIPDSDNRALCLCDVLNGKNLGFSTCKQREKQKASYDQVNILSTFSFGNMRNKYVTCPAGIPWTNCLDQGCIIDKNNPNKAHCNCKIEKGTSYVTFAGDCNISSCGKSMWSGAKINDNLNFIEYLNQSIGLKNPLSLLQCNYQDQD